MVIEIRPLEDITVVFMGCNKSVYFYSRERGFVDPPERYAFEEPGINAAAALVATRQLTDMEY